MKCLQSTCVPQVQLLYFGWRPSLTHLCEPVSMILEGTFLPSWQVSGFSILTLGYEMGNYGIYVSIQEGGLLEGIWFSTSASSLILVALEIILSAWFWTFSRLCWCALTAIIHGLHRGVIFPNLFSTLCTSQLSHNVFFWHCLQRWQYLLPHFSLLSSNFSGASPIISL